MKYNPIRHLELFRRLQDLKKQEKSLYKENQKEYLELLEYRSILQNHIFWKNRHQFLLLMENFVNGIIDGEEFCGDLSGLYRKILDLYHAFETDFEKLKDFQPDLRSKGFGLFVSFLRCQCDAFEPNSTFVECNMLRENEDLTEEQLKDSIRDASLRIQKDL